MSHTQKTLFFTHVFQRETGEEFHVLTSEQPAGDAEKQGAVLFEAVAIRQKDRVELGRVQCRFNPVVLHFDVCIELYGFGRFPPVLHSVVCCRNSSKTESKP